VYLVGKTGADNSTFLENLLLRSLNASLGAALIDPHGNLFRRVLETLRSRRRHNVAVLHPSDAGHPVVNLLRASASALPSLVASGAIDLPHTVGSCPNPSIRNPRDFPSFSSI
jgi:hypothetical protein